MAAMTTGQWGALYRPEVLSEVYGQDAAVSQIRSFDKSGFRNTYLITGDAGLGKTTLARIIFARMQGFKSTKELGDEFRDVNCGAEASIAEVRLMIESTQYMPPNGARYRTYLLDEAHLMSPAAKSALLKPLEEPPSHVVWALCTNEPEKVIDTVHQRAARINLERVNDEGAMRDLLKSVLEKAGAEFKSRDDRSLALDKVIEIAAGCPRIAVNTMQSVYGHVLDGKRVEDAVVEAIRNQPEVNLQQTVGSLLSALYSKDATKYRESFAAIPERATALATAIWLHDAVVNRTERRVAPIQRGFREHVEKLKPSDEKVMRVASSLYRARLHMAQYAVTERQALAIEAQAFL